MTQNNLRKRAPVKIRTSWSNKSRYNSMKAKRPYTPEMMMTNVDTIDIDKKASLSVKGCDRYGLSCSNCKQGAPHPLPQESDWSDKDRDGTKSKAGKEPGELTYYQIGICPNPNLSPIQKAEEDKLDIDKLHIAQDSPKEEQIKVTDLLILLPMTSKEEKAMTKEMTEEMKWQRNTNMEKNTYYRRRSTLVSLGQLS